MVDNNIDSLTKILSHIGVKEEKGEGEGRLLSFEGQGLKLDNEESAKSITEKIENFKGLKILELKGNTIGIGAAKEIGKALEKHPTFQQALWSDLFTGRLKTEIPDALRNLTSGIIKSGASLVTLDLSDNAFGPNGMTGLVDFLSSSSCFSLSSLLLNNNGLGITGGKMLAESLLRCHENSLKAGKPLKLKVFVSGRGRLENEGAKALSKAFKAMKSLEKVIMPQNGINHEGISSLAESFSINPHLSLINLSDNTFTLKGSLAMAKALKKLDNLEEINFEDCLTRTKGTVAIGNALKGKNNLKVVKLSGNEIRREGGTMVTQIISGLQEIQRFEINSNQLGEEGINEIKKILNGNQKSQILGSLSDDEGSDEEEEKEEGRSGEEDEEEEEKENNENAIFHQNNINSNNTKTTIQNKYKQLESFLNNPSLSTIGCLGNEGQELSDFLEDNINNLNLIINALFNLSELYTKDNTVDKMIEKITDEIFIKITDENSYGWICNTILSSFSFIKKERPSERQEITLRSSEVCFSTFSFLSRLLVQPYFHSNAKNIIIDFIKIQKSSINCKKEILENFLKYFENNNN